MNDNDNTTKNKPSVYYTEKKPEPERRFGRKKPEYDNAGSSSRKGRGKPNPKSSSTERSSRIETFDPKKERSPAKKQGDKPFSPWQAQIRKEKQQPTYLENEKSSPYDNSLRKQRQEETFVYSENSCQSVFKQRPESIIKAFLTETMTTKFRDLVMWLAENRLGYDVVSDEQMTKLSGTPHHGGICLIVKKRKAVSALDYLQKHKSDSQDCVLAIDDMNNPHNLGALIRSAAFFSVNGVILRHPDTLELGSALRVAEGGAEYLEPIKADDMAATLAQFKREDYHIVALLPCKIKSVEAKSLFDIKLPKKVVFVLFQQVSKTLIQSADEVVYLPGSEQMPALNISVATGILLAQWQNSSI